MSTDARPAANGSFMFFVAGIAIGSVVTALVTPRSGEEMRRQIKNHTDKLKNKTADTINEMGDKVEGKMQETKDASRKVAERIRNSGTS